MVSRLREWLRSAEGLFWVLTLAVCVLAAVGGFLVGRDWVGRCLAQREQLRGLTSAPEEAGASTEEHRTPLAQAPVIVIREREPTEAEKRELELEGQEGGPSSEESVEYGEGSAAPGGSAPASGEASPAPESVGGPEGAGGGAGPEAAPPATAPAQPAAAVPSSTPWQVTAGSYRERRNAEQVAASLAAQGITVRIEVVQVRGQTYHRVVAGPYSSRAQAQAAAQQIEAAGYPSQVRQEQ
jgi:cell division protein FtsN